jgi:hypothetical protein
MQEQLSLACERCGRGLADDRFALSVTTDAGERRAYECACGAVTISVVRE